MQISVIVHAVITQRLNEMTEGVKQDRAVVGGNTEYVDILFMSCKLKYFGLLSRCCISLRKDRCDKTRT